MRIGLHLIFFVCFIFSSCGDLFQFSNDNRKGRPTFFPATLQEPDDLPVDFTRPDGQVFIQNNICICNASKPESLGSLCPSVCADTNTTRPFIYFSVSLGPDIELNTLFGTPGDLNGWCKNDIGDGNPNPDCVIEYTDGVNVNALQPVINPRSLKISADVSALNFDKTYVLRIVETTSGASSNAFQVRRKRIVDTDPTNTLKIIPIHQYSCIIAAPFGDGPDNPPNTDVAVRQYYYYPHSSLPPALSPAQPPPKRYCHDIFQYGNNDNPLFPRLELIQQSFFLWNATDRWFFDLDGNNEIDINGEVRARLIADYNFTDEQVQGLQIFSEFRWPTYPEEETAPGQGYIMQPWVDTQANDVFCPTLDEYNGDNPIFNILKDFVGVDTEGIYLSKREPQTYINEDGIITEAPAAYILIRESLLKQIWFYRSPTGLAVPANANKAKTETIYYYWPPCVDQGCLSTVRQADQTLFTVGHPTTLFPTTSGEFGFRTDITAPDKRFACIPKGRPNE